MATQVFNPRQFSLNVSGVKITGWDSIEISRQNPTSSSAVSADGKAITRMQLHDKRGTMVVTLQASSEANSFFDALRQSQEKAALKHFPIVIDDDMNTEVFGTEAWIQELPSFSWGTEAGTRQWTFGVANAQPVITPQTSAWNTIKNSLPSIITDIFS